jgi:hypothetical protein
MRALVASPAGTWGGKIETAIQDRNVGASGQFRDACRIDEGRMDHVSSLARCRLEFIRYNRA